MLSKIPLPQSQSQWQKLFLVYIIIIAILSLTPTDSEAILVHNTDKVGHFLAYVLMAVIALITFQNRNGRIKIILLTLIIAFLLEWGQRFVPGRVSSLADGITNYLGLLTGMIGYWLYLRRFRNR